MLPARRSAFRAITAAQAFRAVPVAQRSTRLLGRRFYSSEKGHEQHRTSDLPWSVSPQCILNHHPILTMCYYVGCWVQLVWVAP